MNIFISHSIKIAIILVISFGIKNILDFTGDKLVEKTNNRRLLTIKQIMHSISSVIISILALIMILQEVGFNITPLLAGAGILGVALGLGMQHTMKDLISGFLILFDDKFVVGDKIKTGDVTGIIEKINLRTITLKDENGNIHIISNGSLDRVTILKS